MFLAYLYWDPSNVCFTIPYLNLPVTWYGILFALGVWIGYQIALFYLKDILGTDRARILAEKGSHYVIIATIIGARLGHIFFYENPMRYLSNPLSIFKTWEGGLASHGAIVAIIIALILFARRYKKEYPECNFLQLLDIVVIPILIAGVFIRVGNFFNQEILGIPTNLPWAIIFGHPADGSPPIPYHPAQLYEALFYLFFAISLHLYRRTKPLVGKISGLTIAGGFLFRFFIEFIKSGQSVWFDHEGSALLMGQLLSLPMIALGLAIFFQRVPWRSRS